MKNSDVKIGMRVILNPETGICQCGTVSGISSKLPLVDAWIDAWIISLDYPIEDIKGDSSYKGWTAVTLTPDLFEPDCVE